MPSLLKSAISFIFGASHGATGSTAAGSSAEIQRPKSAGPLTDNVTVNKTSAVGHLTDSVTSSVAGGGGGTSPRRNSASVTVPAPSGSGASSKGTSQASDSPAAGSKHGVTVSVTPSREPSINGISRNSASIASSGTSAFNHNAVSDQRVPAYIDPALTHSADSRVHSLDSAQIAIWEPTKTEKDAVKQTWSDDFNFLFELGASIYSYIFENNPNTIHLFPSIHQHGERYKESREFRAQALNFVQTISHVVKNIYHMDDVAPFLYRIGERHVKFAQRGFKPEFWNIFLDAMEHAIIGRIRSLKELSVAEQNDAIQVWRRLAFYIITHMKHGYFDRLEAVRNGTAPLC